MHRPKASDIVSETRQARLFPLLLTLAAGLFAALLFLKPTLTEAAPQRAGERSFFVPDPPTIKTHLYELQLRMVQLDAFEGSGGAIEPLGDGLLLVTTRGRIAQVQADDEVRYLPRRVPMNASDAADPTAWPYFRVADILLHERRPGRFALFVSHHYFTGDCVEFRVSSISLRQDQERATLSGVWKTVFRANPCVPLPIFEPDRVPGGGQAGGRMLMDGADHLLVAVGDHGWHESHVERARPDAGGAANPPPVDPDFHLGALVRIELASGEIAIVAGGFRNMQGLARDAAGNLWLTDHGPRGGDELNLVQPGLHYGWPYVTYGIQYGRRVWPYTRAQSQHDGYEEPAFVWIPSIATSNLIAINSSQFPLWNNDLLIGSLRARSLFRVRLRAGRAVFVEPIWIDDRIRDMTQLPDGRIAMLTDRPRLVYLQRAPLYCRDENFADSIYAHDRDDDCLDILTLIREAEDPRFRSLHDAKFNNLVIRSLFHVYIYKNWLIYAKTPCDEQDLAQRFVLHITPVYAKDLAQDHEEFGVNVHDFQAHAQNVGVAMNENGCVVARALPDYEIDQIYTGQSIRIVSPEGDVSYQGVWDGKHTFTAAAPRTEDARILSNEDIAQLIAEADDPIIRSLRGVDFTAPVIRALFNAYMHEDWMIYVKSRCSQDDLAYRFFLHVTPARAQDLLAGQAQHGFNIYDFDASDDDVRVSVNEKGCVVVRALPAYPLEQIYTGQVIRVESPEGNVSWKGPVWEGRYTIGDPRPAAPPQREDAPPAHMDAGSAQRGAALFVARCASCHNLTATHQIGPHLDGVIGRRAGAVDGFDASAALTALGIVWTRESLADFIANPSQFAPGTTMSSVGVTAEEAQQIADFLATKN